MSAISIHQEQERDRRTGLIATLLFHALLVVLFLLFGLEQPNPLPEDIGIETAMANFGTSESGSGTTETPDPGTQQSSAAPVPDRSEETPDEVATQDDSPVTQVIPEKPKPKPKPTAKPEPKPEKPKEPTMDSRLAKAINSWGRSGGDSGQGDEIAGNEGVRDGKPDGNGPVGIGDGVSVTLDGRGVVRGPSITDKPNEGGKVVLDIFVDRGGKVSRVAFNLGKSTTTSQILFNIAKKAALQCAFSAKPGGAAEQKGEMSFIFILQ